MSDNLYCYAKGELLDNPNDYSFSKFYGARYLLDWRELRQSCLATNIEKHICPDNEALSSDTKTYLEEFIHKLSNYEQIKIESKKFDLLIKNFEVKKKIYQGYKSGFTSKNRDDYRDLGLYLLFCEALSLAYEKFNELYILNALIKCIDIMCAYVDYLSLPQRACLNSIIELEVKFIQGFINSSRITT